METEGKEKKHLQMALHLDLEFEKNLFGRRTLSAGHIEQRELEPGWISCTGISASVW